jgi:hypothetical protein
VIVDAFIVRRIQNGYAETALQIALDLSNSCGCGLRGLRFIRSRSREA